MSTKEKIESVLQETFNPTKLEVVDQSAAHAGHLPMQVSGGGHFKVTIVSNAFEGKGMLERHRAIYDCFKDELQSEIHALSIEALTEQE